MTKRKLPWESNPQPSSTYKRSYGSHRNTSYVAPSSSNSSPGGLTGLSTPPASSQPISSSQQSATGYPSSSQRASQTYKDYTPTLGQISTQHSKSERDSWQASTQDQEADIAREIDLTEDFDDDVYENFMLYGILNTKIVGCRFYDGQATVGEYVRVKREPSNPYDTNAIRIDNVLRDQIGHIGRQIAAKVASFMDSGSLLVEGALTGPKTFYDCPIGLKLFGTNDPVASVALAQQMQQAGLPVTEYNRTERERKKREQEFEKQRKAREKAAAAMQKKGMQVYDPEGPNRYSNLAVPTQMQTQPTLDVDNLLTGTSTINLRDIQDAMKKLMGGEDVLEKMSMADQPAELATILLPYQRQGLQWMLDHESPRLPQDSEDVVQMFKKSGKGYINIATNFYVGNAPRLASGGLLADDMGLGKTIQVISLIMADPKKDGSPTLIIAPLSVMSNWSGQAAMHVKKKFAPRMLIYHGAGNKNLSPQELKEYDIIITTYQTMTQELFPYGHQIRNSKAKMSQAACALQAKSRWILTGTPIVNSLKDLYSHVKFLGLEGGLAEFSIFNSTLIRPLKNGVPQAQMLLKALMATLCLRCMKNMKFIDLKLPNITWHRMPVKFLPHEQERYDAFRSEAKGLVEAAKAKKGDNTMTHLLEVLLRLRQTCNHWEMCGDGGVRKRLELIESKEVVDVTNAANRKTLQDVLQIQIDSQEDCPVCLDSLKNPVITACAHTFCRECIERVIETQHKCPMCRNALADSEHLIGPVANFGESEEIDVDIDPETTSSKIEELVQVLKASENDPDVKTVVFSQWTSFLDLVQNQLMRNGLNFTRLDGKMNSDRRDAAIESLNTDASCKIMLASLSVCSVGLNLVAANQVILADSWWAPAIEDQAVDRVHRLGQARDCKVIRLVVEGTIEDEVLEIQAKKRKLASETFREKVKREERRAGTLRDIERLLA